MMPDVLGSSSHHAKPGNIEPDYFGYYIREVQELFAQPEDFLSSLFPQDSLPSSSKSGKNSDIHHHVNGSSSLFSNAIGCGLSDFTREGLKASLKQSVSILSQEVDEMVDPVLNMSRIKKLIQERDYSISNPDAADGNVKQSPCKKQKRSSPHSSTRVGTSSSNFCEELHDDFSGPEAKELVQKYSDDLSAKLEKKLQDLETFIDTVMSKCRKMTPAEKQQLQKQIKELPPKNLHRVFEIVEGRMLQGGLPCNDTFVDLEKQDNATLWRLYFYMEAVSSSKKLPFRDPA